MNLKRLSKEKRDHLILVAMITAVILGGLGFGLIRFQYEHLRTLKAKHLDSLAKLQKMKDTIGLADAAENQLTEAGRALGVLEENMATGDPYSWALDLVRRFRLAYRVDIPGVAQPIVGESSLLPKFPYRQASFTLSGNGFYHEIGRFIADFENQYPEIRIVNLSLSPLTGSLNEDREKLEFKMDIVALMRPNPS